MNIPNDCVLVKMIPDFYLNNVRLETWRISQGEDSKTIPIDIYEKVMDEYGCLEVIPENPDYEAEPVDKIVIDEPVIKETLKDKKAKKHDKKSKK